LIVPIDEIVDVDAVIVTHTHLDHCGRRGSSVGG
jgi:glyoxylase-like metal-dependent hydrolase (beta-lactamase superfamily II)